MVLFFSVWSIHILFANENQEMFRSQKKTAFSNVTCSFHVNFFKANSYQVGQNMWWVVWMQLWMFDKKNSAQKKSFGVPLASFCQKDEENDWTNKILANAELFGNSFRYSDCSPTHTHVYTWNLWTSSILWFEPSKRRPFPFKTKDVWVPGTCVLIWRSDWIQNSLIVAMLTCLIVTFESLNLQNSDAPSGLLMFESYPKSP